VNFINSKKSPNLKAGYARSVEEALNLIGIGAKNASLCDL
jgi:hypothetical protein